MSRWRSIRIVFWSLVAVAWIGATALMTGIIPFRERATLQDGSGVAAVGGPFRLKTHKGEVLTDADLRGRPFLVFFGFTHCPDVCPTTLAELSLRYEALGADADKLTMLVITVDPKRDTQEVLAQYMEAFDPRFIALRGTVAETEAIAKAYKAFVQKVPLDGGYTMDHQAIVYMMDRDGRFVGSLDRHESEDIQLAKLRRLIAE
jgi:protein SCO1/2